MSCPFCDVFASYQRQIGRRLETDTFAMSEESARLLVSMAAQIRNAAQATVRLVGHEGVPMMLCDLLDGLAEGLIEGICCKLAESPATKSPAAPSAADHFLSDNERDPCPAARE